MWSDGEKKCDPLTSVVRLRTKTEWNKQHERKTEEQGQRIVSKGFAGAVCLPNPLSSSQNPFHGKYCDTGYDGITNAGDPTHLE